VLAGGVAAALLLVACSDDDAASPETTVAAVTTTTLPARADDGQLVIGVLLPTTGEGAQLGEPMIEGARIAVDRVNDAGGFIGRPVRLVEVDEATTASASLGFDTLLDDGVDAIVGPASSIVALADLDIPVSAGVVTCSPTATALSLDNYPDNGLFFRTIPSDSLQAIAIAQVAERTGATSVSIGFVDDTFGRDLRDAVAAAVGRRGLTVSATVGFDVDDDDLSQESAALLDDGPGVVILLADADDGSRLLASLDDAVVDDVPAIVVNDALRAMPSQVVEGLDDDVREAVRGVAPVAISTDDEELPGLFAANAYDCVNLIALAAVQAGTDSPARIASQIASVSVGGSLCRTFAGCAENLALELQINYNGPSGNTDLSTRTGDPTRARFEEFEFDGDGRDVSDGTWFEVTAE
jgi:branched-chain amino acid transport system substrate-binding protein